MNPLRLVALCALLITVICPAQITVEINSPPSGHFWATGPLPLDTAPILVGENGVMGYRLETLGEHSAIYGVEGFGELIDDEGVVVLKPATEADVEVRLWGLHPAVLDDPAAIAGVVAIDGEKSIAPRWASILDGEHRKRFRATHDLGDYWCVLWFDVMARSPVVHVAGFIARKDRTPQRRVPVMLRFGEQISFPSQRLHQNDLKLDDGAILGEVDLEHGGIYPIRFTLLCQIQPPTDFNNDTAPQVDLDDLDSEALSAGKGGPRYFLPTTWRGPWLGVTGVGRTSAGSDLAARGHQRWSAAHRMTDLRPWSSMPSSGQGGSQASLAMSWFAPVFAPIASRPHEVHLWSADDLALRPMLLFEPGTTDPVTGLLDRGASVASRQIFESSVDLGVQNYPKFKQRGVIPVNLPSGNQDFRTSGDELHYADLPAVAAFAMTNDPVVGWVLCALRGLDLAQRQTMAGWRSSGRGEGRVATSMLLSALCFGGEDLEATKAHLTRRLEVALDQASSKDLPVDAISRPLAYFNDGRLACEPPQIIAYEEAQCAYGFWLLYTQTGDQRAADAAYRFGLTVAATLYRENGRWRVPYAFHQQEDGTPLTDEQLRDQPRMVHPSSGWTLAWSGAGLAAFRHVGGSARPDPGSARGLRSAGARSVGGSGVARRASDRQHPPRGDRRGSGSSRSTLSEDARRDLPSRAIRRRHGGFLRDGRRGVKGRLDQGRPRRRDDARHPCRRGMATDRLLGRTGADRATSWVDAGSDPDGASDASRPDLDSAPVERHDGRVVRFDDCVKRSVGWE
jgi:hypothetical protein